MISLLNEPENGDWLIGMAPVITNLWKGELIYALVTAPKNGRGSRRLFLCTADPGTISFYSFVCPQKRQGLKSLPSDNSLT